MDHAEIRAIRGSLSRAAFARLLGVTSLTVLRWELPEDNKEARRPRAKMVESLRRLAAEGVGLVGPSVAPPELGEAEEEDDGASEPITVAKASAPARRSEPPAAGDEALLDTLLEQLGSDNWRQAEDNLLALLSTGTLSSAAGRKLATLGLVQVQILARMDVRGALAVLVPILDEADSGELPAHVAARAHVMAAMVFAAPDSRVADLGRVNAHVAKAERLLAPEAHDLWVMSATCAITGARFLGSDVVLHTYQRYLPHLERGSSALSRVLADGLSGLAATARDESSGGGRGARALATAEALGHWGLVMGILSDYAWRVLRGSQPPEATLGIAQHARAQVESLHVTPTEGFIRVLAAECEALCRLARFDDATRVAGEAVQLARRGGLSRFALTAPLTRVYMFINARAELEAWAKSFEEEAQGAQQLALGLHAAYARALLASLNGDYAGAAELCERVCAASETTPGVEYVLPSAAFELIASYALSRQVEKARAAWRRFQELLELRPSVWHATMARRAEAMILIQLGRFGEARQRIESTLATFNLLGDIVQASLESGGMAIVALATGAPGADQEAERALARIEQLGVNTDFLRQRVGSMIRPIADGWHEQTLPEKLVVAMDRLAVKGLEPSAFRQELRAVVASIFPSRELLLGGAELVADDASLVEATLEQGELVRFGVRGALEPEPRAALAMLAAFVRRRAAQPTALPEAEAQLDGVLPAFVAAAAATRRLKAEIVQLSRSNATILITGESGTGKEVVARAVHDVSQRAEAPYVAFNCASVPRDLFESQLFGFRRGAFTGAISDSPGVIGAADGGTLFLDEIGELPLEVQPKLLRFLENGEVLPLGEQRARRVNVRVVAATHRDLSRQVKEGLFREDLFYRLNVVPLCVPPLRERKADVTALARLFIGKLVPEGESSPGLSSDAIRALEAHSWPGNVRELRNVVERAMAYAPVPSLLRAEHLRIARA